MTEYGTIKIPREAYECHNDRRKDLGLSWAEYIDGEAPDDNRDAVEESLRTIEERTGRIERTLDELGGR